jgi:AcrR family transcriptional regulator
MKKTKLTPDTEKKIAILKAALDLITENGFHNAPMSVIAKKAAVATGTIYHHFASKEELINGLYALGKENMGKALIKSDEEKLPYQKRFRQVWKGLFAHFLKHPAEFLFLEQYANSPFISQVTREQNEGFYRTAIDLLAVGIRSNKLRKMDIELMTGLVYGHVSTCVKLHLSGQVKISGTRLEHAVESSWDSVRK